jgi:hypothetical protein
MHNPGDKAKDHLVPSFAFIAFSFEMFSMVTVNLTDSLFDACLESCGYVLPTAPRIRADAKNAAF